MKSFPGDVEKSERRLGLANQLYRKWKALFGGYVEQRVLQETHFRRQFAQLVHAVVDFSHEFPAAFAFLESQHQRPYLDQE